MKDPAFLFYSSDFLTGVSDLNYEEIGVYITLLCLQHQKGRLSQKVIDMKCRGIATADVMAKFEKDENGFFYNSRLEKESAKRRKHSNKQRERALNGWKKRKATVDATAYATALPLENENENENENRIRDENENEKIPKIEIEKFETDIDSVINHFVETTSRHLPLTDYESRRIIKQRLDEGHTTESLNQIIELKTMEAEKAKDPMRQRKFLQPKVLFGKQFIHFLNDVDDAKKGYGISGESALDRQKREAASIDV